jgi:hypothetical protein
MEKTRQSPPDVYPEEMQKLGTVLLLSLTTVTLSLAKAPKPAPKPSASGSGKSAPAPKPSASGSSKSAAPSAPPAPPPAPSAAPAPPPVAAPAGGLAVTLDCNGEDSSKPGCDLGVGGASVGKGERFGDDSDSIQGGFLEGTTAYLTSVNGVENSYDSCTSHCEMSALYKVDLLTGKRSILSGYYKDPRSGPRTIGSGPFWKKAASVVRGSDGALYVYNIDSDHLKPHQVYRVSASGDRTEIWNSATQECASPAGLDQASVATHFDATSTMTAGPNNMVYFAGVAATKEPSGSFTTSTAFARLDTHSGKCEMFSVVKSKALGSGASVAFSVSPHYSNGNLYVVGNDSLYSVDVKTGARAVLSKGNGGGMIGSGPRLGTFFVFPAGDKVWTTGNSSRIPVSVDTESGDRTELKGVHGPSSNVQIQMYGIVQNRFIVGGALNAIHVLDTSNGNSMILSR